MPYVPNATQTTEPVEGQTVESAALEFRTLKTRVNALETATATEDTRDLRVPEATITAVPSLAARAGKVLGFDAGGNPIAVTVSGATDPSLRADLAASSGASLSGFMPTGAGGVATTVQNQLYVTTTADNYIPTGTVTATDDCYAYLQGELDKRKTAGGRVTLGPYTYKLSAPLVVWPKTELVGVRGVTALTKSSATTYTGSSGIAKNCLIYMDAVSGFNFYSSIKNINLTGAAGVHGIYMGNTAHAEIENIRMDSVATGIGSASVWMSSFSRVRVNSVGFAFDFNTSDDKTSLHFENCYAEACGGGYAFTATKYSSLTSCGADYINTGGKPGNPYGASAGGTYNAQGYVFAFASSDIVLNGCGCESSTATYITMESSNITMNSCTAYQVENYFGATAFITSFIQLRGVTASTLILNGCAFSLISNQSGVTTNLVKGMYIETPSVQKIITTSLPVVTGYAAGFDYEGLAGFFSPDTAVQNSVRLPYLYAANSNAKGIVGLNANRGKCITGQVTVAAGGVADFVVGFIAMGFLLVSSEVNGGATTRTTTTFSVMTRGGDGFVATAINTANGSGGPAAFSVSWVGSEKIRITNGTGSTVNIDLAYFGL